MCVLSDSVGEPGLPPKLGKGGGVRESARGLPSTDEVGDMAGDPAGDLAGDVASVTRHPNMVIGFSSSVGV